MDYNFVFSIFATVFCVCVLRCTVIRACTDDTLSLLGGELWTLPREKRCKKGSSSSSGSQIDFLHGFSKQYLFYYPPYIDGSPFFFQTEKITTCLT